jgi:hypothetical protein
VEDHLIKVRKLVNVSRSLISDEEQMAPPAPLAPIPQISKDDVAATEKLTEFIKSKDTTSKKSESKNKEEDGSVKDDSGDVSFFDQI